MRKFLKISLLSAALLGFGLTANSLAQPLSAKGQQLRLTAAEQSGYAFLQNRTAALSNAGEFRTKRVFIDDNGFSHLHVQQTLNGIPVWGSEAIVHMSDKNEVVDFTDNLRSSLSVNNSISANTIPSLDEATATQLAVDKIGCVDCLSSKPQADLWIFPQGKRNYLVYRVQLDREDGTENTSMPVFFIDAHTGKTIWQYDNLQTATGSGASLYSGTVRLTTYQKTIYYLEDISRKVGTFDFRNKTTSTLNRVIDTDNIWTDASTQAAVDAHYGAENVVDYYSSVHGRLGIDGSGGPAYYTSADGVTGLITSKVHYSTRYNNAYWNGSFMTYGDGDGTTFTPLVTLDICGHEMTHGVTERTAALTYSNESGALNEAVSDIFGSMVERFAKGESANTWKIGEDAYTPGTSGDALRYMNNPTLGNQPDYYPNRYTGTSDNGGVHTNSGIANYAFYLLAKGGTTSRGTSMTGVGADVAQKIWYKALTTYMTSSTNFKGARAATLSAAAALYGSSSANYVAVANSWTLVGVK